jgi:CBS domain-containing protein
MKIKEILRYKGHTVITIEPSRSVLDAVRVLVERNIGGIVVTEGERPTGILTERDVLRLAARDPADLGSLQVGDVMTRELITAHPEDELGTTMDLMTSHKVRHLPIIEGGRLVGIVSIGDLLNACRISAEEENSYLRQYVQGVG